MNSPRVDIMVEMLRNVALDLDTATDKSNNDCVMPFRIAGIVKDMHVGFPEMHLSLMSKEDVMVMKLEWYAGQLLTAIDEDHPAIYIQLWLDSLEGVIREVTQ